jgi:hypothetical protein
VPAATAAAACAGERQRGQSGDGAARPAAQNLASPPAQHQARQHSSRQAAPVSSWHAAPPEVRPQLLQPCAGPAALPSPAPCPPQPTRVQVVPQVHTPPRPCARPLLGHRQVLDAQALGLQEVQQVLPLQALDVPELVVRAVLEAHEQVERLGGRAQHAAALAQELDAVDLVVHDQHGRLVHVEERALQREQEAVVRLRGVGVGVGVGLWGAGGGGSGRTQWPRAVGACQGGARSRGSRGGALVPLHAWQRSAARQAGPPEALRALPPGGPRAAAHLVGAAHGAALLGGVLKVARPRELGAREAAQDARKDLEDAAGHVALQLAVVLQGEGGGAACFR